MRMSEKRSKFLLPWPVLNRGRSGFKIFVTTLLLFTSTSQTFASQEDRLSLSVKVSQESYAGKPQVSEQGSQYNYFAPEVNLNIEREYGTTKSELKGYALALVPLTDNEVPSAAMPELYYHEKFVGGGSSWGIGRKKENWSELDRLWAAGLWQPLIKWDASQPIDQGLIGLFWETKGTPIRTNILVSNLFLPDQQPLFKNQDGHLTSSNRWFREPVPALGLSDSYYDINYQINMPNIEDIIFQPTFAAKLEVGTSAWDFSETGAFLRFSFSDKPANQFHIEMDGNFDLPNEPYARVYPHVIRHHLYTVEAGYQWDYSRAVISSTTEEYDPIKLNTENYQSPIVDSRYDGFFIVQDLSPIQIMRSSLTLGYISKSEKNQGASSSLIKEVESSSQRMLFSQLMTLKFEKNFFRKRNSEVNASGQYTYSISDRGEWFRIAADYKFNRSWAVNLAGDIFGVPSGTPTNTSFISSYRGNDRLMGGIAYVF